MDYEREEKFRELCYVGDLDLIRKYYTENKPNVNSINKINGWTALHWASKKNNLKLVEYLLELGADAHARSSDGKLAGDLTKDNEIRKLLYYENASSTTAIKVEEPSDVFIPNFVRHPQFHYANANLYSTSNDSQPHVSSSQNAKVQKMDMDTALEIKSNKLTRPDSDAKNSDLITIKVRALPEMDFIEIDLDKSNTTFEQFKRLCLNELYYLPSPNMHILKIRKLPNIIIRNNKDIQRLKDNQEIEIIFH